MSCRDEKFLSRVQTLRGTGFQKIHNTIRNRFLVRSHHTVESSKQIRQKRQGLDLRCCQLTKFLAKFGFRGRFAELKFQRVHHERYEHVNVGLNVSRIELKQKHHNKRTLRENFERRHGRRQLFLCCLTALLLLLVVPRRIRIRHLQRCRGGTRREADEVSMLFEMYAVVVCFSMIVRVSESEKTRRDRQKHFSPFRCTLAYNFRTRSKTVVLSCPNQDDSSCVNRK